MYPDKSWLKVDYGLLSEYGPGDPYPLSIPYLLYREAKGIVGLTDQNTLRKGKVDVGGGRIVTETDKVLDNIQLNLKKAETYHVDTVKDYCHPNTWLIAGKDMETVTSVHIQCHSDGIDGVELGPFADPGKTDEGDATVPLVSARVLENHPNCRGGYIVSGVTHRDSTNSPDVVSAICDLIARMRAQGLPRW